MANSVIGNFVTKYSSEQEFRIPSPVSFDVVKVDVSASGPVFKSFIQTFIDQIESESQFRAAKFEIDSDMLRRYLITIVAARCELTASGKCSFWHRNWKFRVPAFLYDALYCVGVVEVRSMGLVLEPNFVGDKDDIIRDPVIVEQISNKLSYCERLGFTFAEGLPLDRSGSEDFMMLEVADGHVRSRQGDESPVFALVTAFFESKGVTSVLGSKALRVSYGEIDTFIQKVVRYAMPKTA